MHLQMTRTRRGYSMAVNSEQLDPGAKGAASALFHVDTRANQQLLRACVRACVRVCVCV